ncbi:hypothetical protein GCM10009865_05790 [Aeromicrobium ponti]
MPVCKSGIRTGNTCGQVTNIRTVHPYTGLVGIKVYSSNPTFACKEDSGSVLYYDGNNIFKAIGILSAGSTTDDCNQTIYFTPLVEMLDRYDLNFYTSDTNKKL